MSNVCDVCGATAPTETSKRWTGSVRGEETCEMCVYCRHTLAGNSFWFPQMYESRDVLCAISAAANVLERRVLSALRDLIGPEGGA